jgi:hypothetical protein
MEENDEQAPGKKKGGGKLHQIVPGLEDPLQSQVSSSIPSITWKHFILRDSTIYTSTICFHIWT